MSNRNRSHSSTINRQSQQRQQNQAPQHRNAQPDSVESHDAGIIQIAIPYDSRRPPGYESYQDRSSHIEAQLNKEQATALRNIRYALNARAMRTKSGRFVQSNADAVRWLLEQIDAQMEW